LAKNEEENIPLTQSLSAEDRDCESPDNGGIGKRKGKERAHDAEPSPIFDVGDWDEDGGEHSH
jgi:hypothetical protein